MFYPESQNLYLSFISQENRSSSNAQILRILNSRFALEHNLRFALEHNSNTTRTQLEHNTNTTGTKKGNREFNYKTYFHESRGVGELRYNNQCDVRSYVVLEGVTSIYEIYNTYQQHTGDEVDIKHVLLSTLKNSKNKTNALFVLDSLNLEGATKVSRSEFEILLSMNRKKSTICRTAFQLCHREESSYFVIMSHVLLKCCCRSQRRLIDVLKKVSNVRELTLFSILSNDLHTHTHTHT